MIPLPFQIENYNLYTHNKWIAFLPFEKIEQQIGVESLVLNLKQCDLPELLIPEADIGVIGTNIPIPTRVRKETKTLNFEYLLSSNMLQYKVLYKWYSLIAKEDGSSSNKGNPDFTMDITIFFLDEFKKPTIAITFYGCWINNIASIPLKYETADEVTHRFSVKYAYFKFVEDVNINSET